MNNPDSAGNLANDSDAPPAHRRKTMLMRLALVVGLAAAAWSLWYLLFERGMASTDNAYVAADSAVITPRIAAAVAEVRVTDTQTVKAGDVLVRLDDADARIELVAASGAASGAATLSSGPGQWPQPERAGGRGHGRYRPGPRPPCRKRSRIAPRRGCAGATSGSGRVRRSGGRGTGPGPRRSGQRPGQFRDPPAAPSMLPKQAAPRQAAAQRPMP
ncbi:biotin/lipoyl-binding protein [Novosphingobium sp.]|uniref:biotin/lipoyl-binding protein n=1 Tax=Novosphingobium sp. TaxID=1874826 RepID=UPI0025D9434E|nr:biotin/lipoyl-binding protein [Novosphingobium sp.]